MTKRKALLLALSLIPFTQANASTGLESTETSVCFYKDTNYKNLLHCESGVVDIPTFKSLGINDEVSSIGINGPFIVEFYDDENYSSAKYMTPTSIKDLDPMNDRISSVKIKPAITVRKEVDLGDGAGAIVQDTHASFACLWSERDYKGIPVCLFEPDPSGNNSESLSYIGTMKSYHTNDWMSSITFTNFIDTKIQATLYKDEYKKGDKRELTNDVSFLGDIGFNDNISSWMVFDIADDS